MAGMIELKGGHTTTDPRLDRIPQFDERSRGYGVRELLPEKVMLRSHTWPVRWRLDQGQQGACTNFGLAHNRVGRPKPRKIAATVADAEALAFRLYHRSQQLDEWPGEEPTYSGTSLLAACKAWQEADLLDEYRWAFGIDDVFATLATLGPVVFATDWLDGMFDPDSGGMLHVEGAVAGGHAYDVIGIVTHPARSSVWSISGEADPILIMLNSWGASWGRSGLAGMRAADAERLLKAGGECVVPLDR